MALKKRAKWLIVGLLALAVVSVPVGYVALPRIIVSGLTTPKCCAIPARTEMGGFPVEDVTLTTSDGVALSGWHVRVPGKKAVVLLHGIGANRLQHLAKAELYTKLGYGVLLYDARGHGASQAVQITGGWKERMDLEAALAYMRAQGYERVGANGFSMGAATIAFAEKDAIKPDFAVFESCYLDVNTLIRNAVAALHLPAVFAEPVLAKISEGLGFPAEEMSPIKYLAQVDAPTLMLLGDSEFQVKEDQAKRMLEACGATQKEMYVFQKAGHDVFSRTQPDLYKEYLTKFLEKVEAGWTTPQKVASAS